MKLDPLESPTLIRNLQSVAQMRNSLSVVNAPAFGETAQQLYLQELTKTGDYTVASAVAGVSRRVTETFRANNPDFNLKVELHYALYKKSLLDAALRRAIIGTPRYGVDRNGNRYVAGQDFSDRILELLLRRAFPGAFDQKVKIEHSEVENSQFDTSRLTSDKRQQLLNLLPEANVDEGKELTMHQALGTKYDW